MTRLFLSFDARDSASLASRLHETLTQRGYAVTGEPVRAPEQTEREIAASDAVIALLSPHAAASRTGSTCRDELALARFGDPPRPIIPVMAADCEPPLMIFRLQYVDMREWEQSDPRYEEGVAALLDAISATLGEGRD